jgi:hypothetical protein
MLTRCNFGSANQGDTEGVKMTNTTHTPIEDTIKVSRQTSDAFVATCANCSESIIQWDYIDDDGDCRKRVFQAWAVEVPVRVSDKVTRFDRVEVCG